MGASSRRVDPWNPSTFWETSGSPACTSGVPAGSVEGGALADYFCASMPDDVELLRLAPVELRQAWHPLEKGLGHVGKILTRGCAACARLLKVDSQRWEGMLGDRAMVGGRRRRPGKEMSSRRWLRGQRRHSIAGGGCVPMATTACKRSRRERGPVQAKAALRCD